MQSKIESLILGHFTAISARSGDCIDERWILHKLRPSLNPKEQSQIDDTISGLQTKGLITVEQRRGMLVMTLTDHGYEAIYPTDPVKARDRIRSAILDRFSSTSSKVGDVVDERWVIHQLLPSLNPKEKNELDKAIQNMVSEGLITEGGRLGMRLFVLTQAGFDVIYPD